MSKKKVVIIGAGAAGLESAAQLSALGHEVVLIEKEAQQGGHIGKWHALFPDLRPGREIVDSLTAKLPQNVVVHFGVEITAIQPVVNKFAVSSADGWSIMADAVLMATGFDLFDTRKKEEYGYGVYDKVITSADLENIFSDPAKLTGKLGKSPSRIGFVHCVGSRDEKAGNIYCSKVCCVTAVKQAIELKQMFPDAEIFCFYMDLRMFGRYYEEMYKEAQEVHNIQFIRGRLSEASEDRIGHVVLKVEDTLLGKPLKITVDLLVLMPGMVSPPSTIKMRDALKLGKAEDKFLKSVDNHLLTNHAEIPGLFVTGTCTGPKTLTDTLTDARSASLALHAYLTQNN